MTMISGAVWRPLPENNTQGPLHATQCIFHTAVTKADSIWGYFASQAVVVESHLFVSKAGVIEQYMSLDVRADAQAAGNSRAISVETWDDEDPDHVPWNPAQVAALVKIAVDVHNLKGIPLVRATAWDAPGFGGHHDFPQWNPNNHNCPGGARFGQIDLILAQATAIVNQVVAPPVVTPKPLQPGVKAPAYPLSSGSYFGPKTGPKESVSGFFSHREDLRLWQARMAQRGWTITADGLYGPGTTKVAKAFQTQEHIIADGLIGPATWNAAWTSPVKVP